MRERQILALGEVARQRAGNSPSTDRPRTFSIPHSMEAGSEHASTVQLLVASERTLRDRSHPMLPRALTIKGMALGDAGDYVSALALYREALGLLEDPSRPRDPLQEAACFGAIGLACTQLVDFAEAEN